MASTASIEILDLRHFAAPVLRPVLDAEGECGSSGCTGTIGPRHELLMQYLDSHMLPGYAAVEDGQVSGYAFCVYEETKAVIGDVFALPSSPTELVKAGTPICSCRRHPASAQKRRLPRTRLKQTLLKHLFETLLNSPQIDRIESQFCCTLRDLMQHFSRGRVSRYFAVSSWCSDCRDAGIRRAWICPPTSNCAPWREEDLSPAGRLISDAYRGHPDSIINDQYRSVNGSQRFLHNIVRYSGCGVFSPLVSHVMVRRQAASLVALVLGSRVSPQSGHITQLCVHPDYRRLGIARQLLSVCAVHFMRARSKRDIAHRHGIEYRGHRSLLVGGIQLRAQV